ncbi:MAG: zinc-binding dehydrogenase [Rickettsiales bacterium]|nr:zinc-binding dehydrogenase [Rickettsiales bacterium]
MGGQGIDVILDMVGGPYIARHLRLAANGGRILSIAFLQGARAEVNFAPLLLKNLTMAGSALRGRSEKEKYQLGQSLRNIVWPLLAEGKIRPVIDHTYPLADAQQAHDRMRGFHHTGKLLLKVG